MDRAQVCGPTPVVVPGVTAVIAILAFSWFDVVFAVNYTGPGLTLETARPLLVISALLNVVLVIVLAFRRWGEVED